MDIQSAIDFFRKEWQTLSNAPFTFVALFVIAFLVAFFAMRWGYERVIQNLKEQLETERTRLLAKDDQLDEYRQRLHLTPVSGSAFSRLTNRELKQKASELVKKIREFLERRHKEDRRILEPQWQQMVEAKTEEERRKLWIAHRTASSQRSLEERAEYDRSFKIDTILLRDEILSRLPKEAKKEPAFGTYEHPTNPIGMGIVADDLERLAKNLP